MFSSRLSTARGALVRLQSRSVSNATELTAPPSKFGFFESFFVSSKMPVVPLNYRFPDLPNLQEVAPVAYATEVTTLENGMKVVSCDSNTPIASVGAFVNTGSRYENLMTSGTSNFLEHFAFKSTTNQSELKLFRETSKLGMSLDCTSGRDSTVYSANALKEHTAAMVANLADTIQNPAFAMDELYDGVPAYKEAVKAILASGDAQLMESLHAAAFHDNTLGMPLYAPEDQVFPKEDLLNHLKSFYTANRMVIAGVGVDHAQLVALAQKEFTSLSADSSVPVEQAVYTGGDVRLHNDSGVTQVALAFQGASHSAENLAAYSVLKTMLGEGAFSKSYSDSGVFGISASSASADAGRTIDEVCASLESMAGAVDATKLATAKGLLKSSDAMASETRNSKLNIIGTQVAATGKVSSAEDVVASIDKVQGADVQKVAAAMLKTPLSLAVNGSSAYVPRYDSIAKRFG